MVTNATHWDEPTGWCACPVLGQPTDLDTHKVLRRNQRGCDTTKRGQPASQPLRWERQHGAGSAYVGAHLALIFIIGR